MLDMRSALVVMVLLVSSLVAQASDTESGKSLFNNRACIGCHSIGNVGSAKTGPNLLGVTKRRTEDWLTRWLKNPDAMRNDPEVVKMRAKYGSDMPNLGLNDDEVQSLILYLKSKDNGK